MMEFDLIEVYNNLPALVNGLSGATQSGIEDALKATLNEARDNAPEGETGALKASGYIISARTNTFAPAAAAMASLNPKAYTNGQPEVDVAEGQAAVGFAANYALPVHDGHHTASGSFVEGQPFLADAVAAHSDDFGQFVQNSIEGLASSPSGISFTAQGSMGIKSWISNLLSRFKK